MDQSTLSDNKTDSGNSQDWEDLQNSFVELYEIKDLDRREYGLHKAAQGFQIPIEVYRKLFQSYSQSQLLSSSKTIFRLFGQSPKKALEKGLDILSRLGWLSMLGILGALSMQLVELWQREVYLSWAIVSLSEGKSANAGRLLALNNLSLVDASLAGLNIENAVLPGLDIAGSELMQSNFRNANLRGANLENTSLVYANLEGTYLEAANLSRANLELASLRGAQLLKANLAEANFERANLERANLSGAILTNSHNLNQALLKGAFYDRKTQFPNEFDPIAFGAIVLEPGADLANTNLTGMVLAQVDLSGADLSNANLNEAFLLDVNLSGANLEGANFEGAIGLIPAQILAARNWEQAIFDQEFQAELELQN